MIDFCIYEIGAKDYWGQFESRTELFNYLKEVLPGFDPHIHLNVKACTEQKAVYDFGDLIRVVTLEHKSQPMLLN